MKFYSVIYVFLVVGVFSITGFSCRSKPKVVDAVSYLKYVDAPDNGLIQDYENEDMDLKITIQYKTPEYLAIKEFDTESYDPDSVLALAEDFKGGYQFGMKISSTVSGYDVIKGDLTPKEYVDRVTYLSTAIKHDFKLVLGIDTVPCSICHYERTYNISPHNEFLLVFPTNSLHNGDLKLLYDDKAFGIGKQEFNFKQKNIKNIPSLL